MPEKNPTISIIGGKGSMGQLFASFFRDHGLKVLISDLNTKLTNKEAAERGDIVIVAVTLSHAEKVIKEVAPFVGKDALLTDITSVKEIPMKAMLKCKGEVLGMHPMFSASNPIPGQPIIVCPTKKSGELANWLVKFLKNRGASIIQLKAKEHDKLMTEAQGVIHFADIVFAHALYKLKRPIKDLLKFTSPASDIKILMAARLISQSPDLYGNIQILNPQNKKVLKQFLKSTEELFKIVKKKNIKKFTQYFTDVQKFLGSYMQGAYQESTWIIGELLSNRRKESQKTKLPKINKNSLAVLGPQGTYTDIAASKYDEKLKKSYFKSIDEAIEAVATGKVKEGIVPIENKLYGSVRETMDGLFYKNIHIVNELDLAIRHCLLTLPHSKKITKVISHSQALNQCKKHLKKHLPKAEIISIASTAAAIEKLIQKQDSQMAVIGPKEAALAKNLKIQAENIANQKNNSTKFIVIRKGEFSEKSSELKHNKTSIAFHFSADSAGSLFTVFKDFADAKLNMTKIESRPAPKKFGEYIFYLDFEGHISDSNVKNTLKKVEKNVAVLKILGSY